MRTGAGRPPAVPEAVRSERFVEVRRRIFRQLIESLIYEGLLFPETEAGSDFVAFRIEGRTEAGEPVLYRCRGRRRFTFGRIRLDERPVSRLAGGTEAEADSLTRFLLEVRASLGADEERLVSFAAELEQTLLNDTLAQHFRHEEGRTLKGDDYDSLESDVMDGHPYHPSYKSRMGFDHEDNYLYGPEFGGEVRPLWVAARKDLARVAISDRMRLGSFLAGEPGAEGVGSFEEKIRRAGAEPDDYVILPVHPWQWRKKVAASFADDLREGRLILLGESEDAYRPQQSIRTLANSTSPERSYLKLSMSIVNTSTGRVLAPHTVANAPAISDWLKGLVEGDPFLKEEARVVMLGEVVGLSYDPPPPSDLVRSATYGILGCVWRESLHRFLEPGEGAIPFNALCALDLDGRPMIEPWVRESGAEGWLLKLFEASVAPVVHFLYAHGVALESHAQNLVLIHENGVPRRLALKDFHDGVRFSRAHLAEPERCPALLGTPEYHARVNRNSFVETDDVAAVRDFFHDAFFFINLGELALFMADRFGFAEERFWGLVRRVIRDHLRRFPKLRERSELFDLFAPKIEVEQLTKRRMFPETELRVHAVANPLSGAVYAGAAKEGGDSIVLRENVVKKKLGEGEPVFGLFCSTPAPVVVEMIGRAGFDFVIIDNEHVLLDPETLENMVRAAEAAGLTPLVRVADRAPGTILRALDAGAQGVVIPDVRDGEDAEGAVRASRYYPEGERSLNSGRPAAFAKMDLPTYLKRANEEVMVVVMIEDREGVERAAEILSVPGVDLVLEGAADLSQSYGVPWETRGPVVREALLRIEEESRRSEVPFCAIPRAAEDFAPAYERGVRAFVLGDERGVAFRALCAHLDGFKGRLAGEAEPPKGQR